MSARGSSFWDPVHGARVGMATGAALGALVSVLIAGAHLAVISTFGVAGGIVGHRLQRRRPSPPLDR